MSLATDTQTSPDPATETSLGHAMSEYWSRVRGGDLGSLPAVLGLIVLIIFFTVLQGATFFSAFNFANLVSQAAMIIVLAMGLVFVLLLGEIDLSAGFLLLTARCSYELVEKAAVAGCPVLVTISAPTTLAVERAKSCGMTLISLAREDSMLCFSDGAGKIG